MERAEKDSNLVTAESLAKIISSGLKAVKNGLPKIILIDIHAIVERYYFSENVTVEYASGIDILLDKITFSLHNQSKYNIEAIVFPDDGAYKRFNKQFPKEVPTIICSKIRTEEGERKISINEIINTKRKSFGSFLIVDDLIQTGGTLIKCAKALKNKFGNESKIAVYATHGVFPNKSYSKFDSDIFDKVFITNTIHHENYPKNFELLNIVDIFPKFLNLKERETIQKEINVFVTSDNERKLYGTYLYFLLKLKYPTVNLFYKNTNKDLLQQPLSSDEINSVMSERHHDVKDNMVNVSIQNGIIDYKDMCFSLLSFNQLELKGVSYGVPVVKEFLEKVPAGSTYGKYMSQLHECDESDWYFIFEEKPRWYMVYKSIDDAFSQ